MKKLILGAASVSLFILASIPAYAGPYEDALVDFKAKNYSQAVSTLKPLASQGNANAQTMLGFMYHNGQGVPQNYVEAARLYKQAALQGDLQAQTSLGYLYEQGIGVPQSHKEAANWYLKATQSGYADAAYSLANLYENGLGVQKNNNNALMLYKNLVQSGHQPSVAKLKALQNRMVTQTTNGKPPPKQDWLVGHWGEADADGQGGYIDNTNMFGNGCAEHDGRGFATISYSGDQLVLDIIGSSPNAMMFSSFDKSTANYTVPKANQAHIYPAKWDNDWLELAMVKPGILSAVIHYDDRKDEEIILRQCD